MLQKSIFAGLWLCILLLLVFQVHAEGSIFTYSGEDMLVELHIQENASCFSEETNIFHIQRANYSSNMSFVELNYSQNTLFENETIFEQSFHKEFKKYTQAQTGYFFANKTGNYTILFIPPNKSQEINWTIHLNCTIQKQNGTINQSFEYNSSDENTSIEINETIDENITGYNQTNQTEQTNQTNQTINESTHTCQLQTKVYTDKNIYSVGDQVQIHFFVEPFDTNTSISYFIEDLQGNYLKTPHTTSNLQTKKYTFKTSNEKEQAFFVKAIIENNCNHSEDEKLIVLQGEDEDKEVQETNIEIKEAKQILTNTKNEIETIIEFQKGKTNKTTAQIYLKDENEKNIVTATKIKLFDEQNKGEIELHIPLPENKNFEYVQVVVEGFGKLLSEKINIKNRDIQVEEKQENKNKNTSNLEIINTYTRQEYVDETVHWYVRAQADGKINISVTTKKNNWSKEENFDGEKTISFELKNISAQEQIKTSIQQGNIHKEQIDTLNLKEQSKPKTHNFTKNASLQTILTGQSTAQLSKNKQQTRSSQLIVGICLTSLLLGVSFGYGPRRLFDRFIKKERFKEE